jgi:hypothetical protein
MRALHRIGVRSCRKAQAEQQEEKRAHGLFGNPWFQSAAAKDSSRRSHGQVWQEPGGRRCAALSPTASAWQDCGMRAPASLRIWFAASVLALSPLDSGAQVRLSPGTVVQLATAEEGRALLGRADEYFARMSAFDRKLRLRTNTETSEVEYRKVVVNSVTGWPDEDRPLVESALKTLASSLDGLNLPLPPRVWVVRTTGAGEVGDSHTRANAIVLPRQSVRAAPELLIGLLAHEFFHLMSRHDARFRERAYLTIGFRMCEHVDLPASIAARRLTNPDALRNDAYIELKAQGAKLLAIPVLLSRFEQFDPAIGTGIADYWMMRLMAVEPTGSPGRMKPVIDNGEPVLLDPSQVQGFFEQIGTNTTYIIHPEEILADHFALMAIGAPSKQPQFIDRLRALLQGP